MDLQQNQIKSVISSSDNINANISSSCIFHQNDQGAMQQI
jgi:hypothetical protein